MSCGDPYDGRNIDILRPVIPKTSLMLSTDEACSENGCDAYQIGRES